jgi:hypothetical protein
MLTTIEKVIFLQDVDIFEYTSTEDLSHIAAITTEIEIRKNNVVYNEDDISDAMYMIIDGAVSLRRKGVEVMEAKIKDVFGTWAHGRGGLPSSEDSQRGFHRTFRRSCRHHPGRFKKDGQKAKKPGWYSRQRGRFPNQPLIFSHKT